MISDSFSCPGNFGISNETILRQLLDVKMVLNEFFLVSFVDEEEEEEVEEEEEDEEE